MLQKKFALNVPGVSGKDYLAPGNGKGNLKSLSRFTGREREYGKGNLKSLSRFTGREREYGKGNLRLVILGIRGNPRNHIKNKVKFKILLP